MDVDDLCSDMALSVGVTEDSAVKVLQAHPHMALYKNRGKSLDQDRRRREELERQKQKRFNALNYARKLANCDLSDADLDDEDKDEEVEMKEVQKATPARKDYYRNQLMLAEWLLFVPPDIEESYVFKMCPVGRHVLLIASKGRTKLYSKKGYLLRTFECHLPGGCRKTRGDRERYFTVLDCILDHSDKTLYVLDVMAWRQTAYYDFAATYRFEWLEMYYKTELEESDETPIHFVVVPSHRCAKEKMKETLALPPPWKVDGFLFYHGEAQYIMDHTTLVCWLKPYMLPELFHMSVHQAYLEDTPSDYVNHLKDIQKYNETREELMKSLAATRTLRSPDGDAMPSRDRRRHNTKDSSVEDSMECSETDNVPPDQ